MSEEAKDEQTRRGSWWISIPLIVLALYLLSGWPYFYSLGRSIHHPSSFSGRLNSIFEPIMGPHVWARFKFEWYFDYTNQAVKVAEPNFILPTWEEVQARR